MARYDYHCPSCGREAERVFDPSGIVFKGSGFYNTDQRGKGTSAPATKCENCPHKD